MRKDTQMVDRRKKVAVCEGIIYGRLEKMEKAFL
jgi:hypothetical protein